jgi:hypothetical protein
LLGQLCIGGRIHHDGRADGRRREPLAARDTGTLGGGFINPGLNAVRFMRTNEWTHFRFKQEGVADAQLPNTCSKTVDKMGVDISVNKDSLDGHAYLTSMVVSAFG